MRVIAFIAIIAVASAIDVNFYAGSGCTGDANTITATNGTCTRYDNTTWFIATCATVSAGGQTGTLWGVTAYDNAACNDTSAAFGGIGASGDCSAGGTGTANVSVSATCSSCFSGNNFVVLEGNHKVHISEVNVGDRVLSADSEGNLFFDKVFRITTWNQNDHDHLRFTTESGAVVEQTGNHYMHIGSLANSDLKLASEVEEGDVVFIHTEAGVMEDTIVSVEAVVANGAYNVHTLSGNLIVNGVVSSHFTSETTWENKDLATIWYKVVDVASPVFGVTDAKNQQ